MLPLKKNLMKACALICMLLVLSAAVLALAEEGKKAVTLTCSKEEIDASPPEAVGNQEIFDFPSSSSIKEA